jgi:hypothetical protein
MEAAPVPTVSTALTRTSSASSSTALTRTSSASSSTSLTRTSSGSSSTSMAPVINTLDDLVLLSESSLQLADEEALPEAHIPYDTDSGGFLYNLDEMQEEVRRQFQEAESLGEPTTLTIEVELDSHIMESISFDKSNVESGEVEEKTIKDEVRQLAKILLLPLEYGSQYYWEIRNVHLNSRNSQFTGCAAVYLGCTQREGREWQRPQNQPVKRRSEVRPPIPRFNCMGSITLTLDIWHQHALVKGSHQEAHEHPQHRQTDFPVKAKQWIKDNRKYNLQSIEIYRRLQDYNLIDPKVHTKEQVYYWASVFNKETYVMNRENQLLSTKSYLEKPEFIQNGFKVLSYLENDFVRALGFTTSLLKKIGACNITEIVIDSTFKTNQERFELFAVNANCGGFGMPIAYLYLLTSEGTEAAINKPENMINTRVQALCNFFIKLRHEGLLPVFVLTDKDAGEIAAVNEAWSWTANIQLCYWHLEHAIDRRLKDKKSAATSYNTAKAEDAHKRFEFIDPKWVPQRDRSVFCPEDVTKELLAMIKRHANMHPLIPVAKDTFWTSAKIHQFCVQETYEFCNSRGLVKLWGYLWTSWYNPKDWKLFARSAFPAAIPLARTTMITESHWRVLKYHYKYNYNRPRLDRLTQILAQDLVPDSEHKLIQINKNRGLPSWWKAFKREWDKAASREMQDGMEERYHIDVDRWICSCQAFLHSPYFLCKHLIFKKNGKTFLPTFKETMRRHDYPFLAFGMDAAATILQENNPWKRFLEDNPVEEVSASSALPQQAAIATQEKIEARREELAEWKKVMERGFELCEREIDNDKFVESFRNLMKPITKAVKECDEALKGHTQQETWGSKGRRLAFWLR